MRAPWIRHALAASVSLMLMGGAASASTITSLKETFDNDGPAQLDFTGFMTFDVTSGTVDLISSGTFSIDCVGNKGKCVDLDGSTRESGTIQSKGMFAPGSYKVRFALSGNQRNGGLDTATFSFAMGGSGMSYTLPGSAPFQTITETITIAEASKISFSTTGDDNISLVLDNVNVQAVPGPIAGAGVPALLAAGGFLWARRRKAAATA